MKHKDDLTEAGVGVPLLMLKDQPVLLDRRTDTGSRGDGTVEDRQIRRPYFE